MKKKGGNRLIFFEYAVWASLAVCAVSDVRRHRIPNAAVAVGILAGYAGQMASVFQQGGLIGRDIFQYGGRMLSAVFLLFPLYLLGMTGAGDIKIIALLAGWMGWFYGCLAIGTGLVIGAVLALLKMLQQGSICQRFLYLTAYIRQMFQEKRVTAYYDEARDGWECVIPLGACFFVGALLVKMAFL